jgi:predicted phosphate transport protein (TIGR00153 family)
VITTRPQPNWRPVVPRFRLRLIPRNETFFELFVNQARNIETAAEVLLDLIDNFDEAPARASRMRDLEHEGDEMTHEIMRRLNTVFVTPLDHEDIHELTTTLDDVIDHMEAAADLFILHKIEAPLPGMKAQADVLVRASKTIREALETLPKYKLLAPFAIEVNRLENEGDRVYRQAIADLFGGDHRALDVLKWRDIIDEMEAAIDRLEDVSDVLEGISLKHA